MEAASDHQVSLYPSLKVLGREVTHPTDIPVTVLDPKVPLYIILPKTNIEDTEMTVSSHELLQPPIPSAIVDQYVNQRTSDPLDRNNMITESRIHLDIVTEEKRKTCAISELWKETE